MSFNPKPVQDFIGQGMTFPIVLVNGRAKLESGFALIRSSIKNILAFEIGTRYYLGEFGSRLNDLIEEPNDQILRNVINTFIIDAISKWEKRVSTISSTIEKVSPVEITVSISYRVNNSQTVDNFIYPFYKQIIY